LCLKCLLIDEIKRLRRRNEKIEDLKPNQLWKNGLTLVALVKQVAVLQHYDCPFAKKETQSQETPTTDEEN